MIFEGRALDDISNDEIAQLVEANVSESQTLEFKATFDHRNDDARLELLGDVVSMANGGGGYLVFGVRDDGRGRAQSFAEAALMNRSDSMVQSIGALCQDHIAERIEGIEIQPRNVNGNSVILVRIPMSGRRPHMVTLGHRTHFLTRYRDGKREMSLAEIREAFVNEPIGLRLAGIEASLAHLGGFLVRDQQEKELTEASQASVSDALLRAEDGRALADVMRRRFENEVGERPFLWLSATPVTPRPRLLPLGQPEVDSLLSAPPGDRPDGWNMAGLYTTRRRSLTGLELGTKEYKYLEVFENGHLEFWTPLDEHFCWNQSEEERRIRPRLHPCPVVEYPVSFLRLAAALLEAAGYPDDRLIQLEYRNAAGYILRPGHPQSISFLMQSDRSKPFAQPHLRIAPRRVSGILSPDEVAFDLLSDVYRAFGVEAGGIPFRDSTGTFVFE